MSMCGFILLLLFAFGTFAPSLAATMKVTKAADSSDGICDADCSLREAIGASANGDVITFSPIFAEPQTITLILGQLAIRGRSLTITGPGQSLLSISGNNAGRVFFIERGAVVGISNVRLTNGFAGQAEGISGGAVSVEDSTLTLNSVTVSNSAAGFLNGSFSSGFGGGVYSRTSNVTVIDSTFTGNSAYFEGGGGAIHNAGSTISNAGTLTVLNSTIADNTGAGVAGTGRGSIAINGSIIRVNTKRGIREGGGGILTIQNSTISQNQEGGILTGGSNSAFSIENSAITNNESLMRLGTEGGGIFSSGTGVIVNCVISNNRVTGEGGGIYNTAQLHIRDSAIINNSTFFQGGGIYHGSIRDLYLTNSTVSGNEADLGGGSGNSPGGGIYSTSGSTPNSIVLTNSTIVNNRATGLGGGLRTETMTAAVIRNTLIASNIANQSGIPDVSGTVSSQGFNLIGNSVGSTGWLSTDLLNLNPILSPLGNNGGGTYSHALRPGSPALNAGNYALSVDPATQLPLVTDQRGLGRLVGASVDIGAHESNIGTLPVNLSGRMTRLNGRAVYMARITLTDAAGTVRYTQSNPFGYFRFLNLPPGTDFTISVSQKFYQFTSPQTVTTEQNRDDLNFVGL